MTDYVEKYQERTNDFVDKALLVKTTDKNTEEHLKNFVSAQKATMNVFALLSDETFPDAKAACAGFSATLSENVSASFLHLIQGDLAHQANVCSWNKNDRAAEFYNNASNDVKQRYDERGRAVSAMGQSAKATAPLDINKRIGVVEDSNHFIKEAKKSAPETVELLEQQRFDETLAIFKDLCATHAGSAMWDKAALNKAKEFCAFLQDKMKMDLMKPVYSMLQARQKEFSERYQALLLATGENPESVEEMDNNNSAEFYGLVIDDLKFYREKQTPYTLGDLTIAEAIYIDGVTIKNEFDSEGWLVRATEVKPPSADLPHGSKSIMDNDAASHIDSDGITAVETIHHDDGGPLKRVTHYQNFGDEPTFDLDKMLKDGAEELYDEDGLLVDVITYKAGEKHGPALTRVDDKMQESFNFHGRPLAETLQELNEIGYIVTGNAASAPRLQLK